MAESATKASDTQTNPSSYDLSSEQVQLLSQFKERISADVKASQRSDGNLRHDDDEFVWVYRM